MQIQNTLNGRREELVPSEAGQVSIYVCGPTTYNFIHLGNARPIVVFDTLRRYLRYIGYQVRYVQNFTDIDDKIINRAHEEGATPQAVAEKYIAEYFQDADALGVLRADVHPRVSEHLSDIIALVEKLAATGHAYERDGDVYFRIDSFPAYGKLSGRSLEDMLAGARIEVDERKENAGDFALWKASKPGEPAWESPWGPGRPGWHIECSVMAMKHLGTTIDIHGGGEDLIFPHHENEIAQSEAATGKPFARYWMHNGFITINNEKMSKSLGNFFIVRDILAKYAGKVVRFYLLSVHYRSPLDFDDGKLQEAGKALERLEKTLLLAAEFLQAENQDSQPARELPPTDLLTKMKNLERQFRAAMDDDLNTARAMSYLFEMSKALNTFIAAADRRQPASRDLLTAALSIYKQAGAVLGLFQQTASIRTAHTEQIDRWVAILVDLRARARKAKNYALADQVRDMLNALQIKLEDTPEGSRINYGSELQPDTVLAAIGELQQKLQEQAADAEAALWLQAQMGEQG